MKVLSLFDGISCGMIALDRAGINVDEYVAYEIDKYAIKISQKNYPAIKHCGSVLGANFKEYFGFDLLIGGSPCQDLCSCGSRKGLSGQKSSLFFEYVRALKEVLPKYFLLENNYSMTKENKNKISEILGCEPILIDSSLVSAQSRKRLYWTNIPINNMPNDKGLFLKDIVVDRKDKEGYNCTQRVLNKVEGTLAKEKARKNTRTLNQKSKCLMCGQNISNTGATNIFYEDSKDFFIPTPVECERLQTIPDNYTDGISNTQRYKCIGNGWTVDVIAHIFSGLKGEVI